MPAPASLAGRTGAQLAIARPNPSIRVDIRFMHTSLFGGGIFADRCAPVIFR
jgi:hypothetical protein